MKHLRSSTIRLSRIRSQRSDCLSKHSSSALFITSPQSATSEDHDFMNRESSIQNNLSSQDSIPDYLSDVGLQCSFVLLRPGLWFWYHLTNIFPYNNRFLRTWPLLREFSGRNATHSAKITPFSPAKAWSYFIMRPLQLFHSSLYAEPTDLLSWSRWLTYHHPHNLTV